MQGLEPSAGFSKTNGECCREMEESSLEVNKRTEGVQKLDGLLIMAHSPFLNSENLDLCCVLEALRRRFGHKAKRI